jgi:hypothetical protein
MVEKNKQIIHKTTPNFVTIQYEKEVINDSTKLFTLFLTIIQLFFSFIEKNKQSTYYIIIKNETWSTPTFFYTTSTSKSVHKDTTEI